MHTTSAAVSAAISYLDSALSLAAAGYPVFPCKNIPSVPKDHKGPLTAHGFKDATTDAETVRTWWTKHPDALIGVPTGAASRLFVIDDDTARKPDAASSAWLAALPSTRTHRTESGGKHHVYAQPPDVVTKCNTGITVNGVELASVDIRGDGGYIIWWPSHGFASEGTIYTPLPQALTAQLAQSPASDRVAPPSPETWKPAELRRALACIPPRQGYAAWIEICQALHHESGGSDEGLALFDEWSAGGLTAEQPTTYQGYDDCRKHWDSFGNRQGRTAVTAGTLYLRAKENGFTPHAAVDVAGKFGGELPAGASKDPPSQAVPGNLAPAATSAPPPPTNPIKFQHIKEILARKSRTEWLPGLKNILERKVIALLVAQRNTFKSFVALEWALRAALAGCGIVVLSGEGGGLDRRIAAWMLTHGKAVDLDKLKFMALEKPVNLNDAQTLRYVSDRIKELGWSLDLFVVDTLSKFTPGLEENDNTENAEFLTALSDTIRYGFDASVLLVAHAGHSDPGRPRGASTLMANPDAEYVVERRDMFVTVTRERLKDSPSLERLAYEGKLVDLGYADDDGQRVTSLAFTLTSAAAVPAAPTQSMGGNQKMAWESLKRLLVSSPDAPDCVPPGRPCAGYIAAVDHLKDTTFEANIKPNRAAKTAIDNLVLKGYLGWEAGWVWVKDMNTAERDKRDTP